MSTLLVETIMEGGYMSLEDCKKALAGTANNPLVKAVISLLEKRISEARQESEVSGTSHQVRDEACGAANYLRLLRTEINGMLYIPTVAEKAAESA